MEVLFQCHHYINWLAMIYQAFCQVITSAHDLNNLIAERINSVRVDKDAQSGYLAYRTQGNGKKVKGIKFRVNVK